MTRRPRPLASATLATLPLLAIAATSSCDEGVSRERDVALAQQRLACEFGAGALGDETVGREFPVGDDIPIDHFILMMQENRSFDHYFGTMPGVDGLPANASNPDTNGVPVAPYHEAVHCIDDVHHSWNASHTQYGGGANDGFVTTNEPNGARAMGYYTEADIPYYRELYDTFAMSDRHFCSVLGPTWVNRWFYLSGTSYGRTTNTIIPEDWFNRYGGNPYNIYMALEQAGISWAVYYSDAAFAFGGYGSFAFDRFGVNFFRLADFYTALEDGTLPQVVFVEPSFVQGVEQTDEHPPASPQAGQAFVAQVVDAVMESDYWARSAVILTYDEHGGYYDHVPPPEACPPDELTPINGSGAPIADAFDRYGFRVPLAVISPFSRPGYVSHEVTDHSSILRLVEARFGLPALTRRDANAWPLLDMFDFENPPFLTPPTLTMPTIDEAKIQYCRDNFEPPIP